MALNIKGKTNVHSNKYIAVHPPVALSIVDHYVRVAKDSSKRVVGVLLGEVIDGKIHATNSFAVPFEEDLRHVNLWYLNHDYLESMAYMFAKVSHKEGIIGWYSTGTLLKAADLEINELMRNYVPHPVYLLVNVHHTSFKDGVAFKAYMSYDEPCHDQLFRRTFAYVSCGVAQTEAEEVAVEHSLRDIDTLTVSTQTTQILGRINGLNSLASKFQDILGYLNGVLNKSLPINATILLNIQNILNYSPDMTTGPFIQALEGQHTISMLGLYTGSLVRTVLAMHDLVKNRVNQNALKEANLKSPESTVKVTPKA